MGRAIRLGALVVVLTTVVACTSQPPPRSAMLRVETPGELPNPSKGRVERDLDALSELEVRASCFMWQLKVDSRARNPRGVVFADDESRRLAEFVLAYDDAQLAEDVEAQIALTGESDPDALTAPADRSRDDLREYLEDRREFLSEGDSGAEFVRIEFVFALLDGNRDRLFVNLSHPALPVSDGSSLSNSFFEVGFEPASIYVEIDSRSDCDRFG